MFRKSVKCRCGKKISKDYAFCPFCGSQVGMPKEPDNILDSIQEMESQMPFMFKFPFKKLVKEIERQMVELDKEMGKNASANQNPNMNNGMNPENMAQGISISINSTNGVPTIKMKQFGPDGVKETTNKREAQANKEQTSLKSSSKEDMEKIEKFSKLPRHEPKTAVRRLSDRIIYELELPGVKDKKSITINKLENSIEIKAFTKDRAYFKLIPLGLPIKKHYLEDEKLILELSPK